MIITKDSMIRSNHVIAVTRGIVPATNFTPAYYTVVVYVNGVSQPLVHTFENEQERDEIFVLFKNALVDGQAN